MRSCISSILAVCLVASTPAPLSAQEPLALARSYLDAYGKFDFERLRPFWSEATVFADPTAAELGHSPAPTKGAAAIEASLRAAIARLLDLELVYDECYHSGGQAVGIGRLHYRLAGADFGPGYDDATFDVRVVSVLRLEGGTVLEHTDYTDLSGFWGRVAAVRRADAPPAFHTVELEEALELAREATRPALVLLSAPGCLACRRMEVEVWRDPRVVAGLAAGALALRIDPRELEAAAETFGVRTYPTLVWLEGGQERARLAGARDVKTVLAWLAGPTAVASGPPRTAGEAYDRALELFTSAADPVLVARALGAAWTAIGTSPDATPLLCWLRRERLPSLLAEVARDPGGRRELEALLVGLPPAGPALDEPAELLSDWLTLLEVLGERARRDAWLEAALASELGRSALRNEPQAFAWLVARERWAEAGALADAQLWSLWLARLAGVPVGDPVADAIPAPALAHERARAADELTTFVRALRAAGRTAEADALEARLESGG